MTFPCYPIGTILQTHAGIFVVVNQCPEPKTEYDYPSGSVRAVSTERDGKHLYKNTVTGQLAPWITIRPDDLAERAIVGTLSERHLYDLIAEIGRAYRK